MSYACVRGLWGDTRILRYRKVLADVGKCCLRPQPAPLYTFCYGSNNERILRAVGFEPTCLGPKPIMRWQIDRWPVYRPHDEADVFYNVNHWRHRLEIWRRLPWRAWCWLDWDCESWPDEAWWRYMESGPAFVARRHWTYCRDAELIKTILDKHATMAEQPDWVIYGR